MPELPEVECVRQTLAPHLIGTRVLGVEVRRRDICESWTDGARGPRRGVTRPAALLHGGTIARLDRHGKQLALIARDGRAVCVHLGMTGALTWSASSPPPEPHGHLVWRLSTGWLRFSDTRRFGGLWTFPTFDMLWNLRWSRLGPDALAISPGAMASTFASSRAAIKAVLLNQHRIAGVGNIYADEALFDARVSPLRPAAEVTPTESRRLHRALHRVLRASISDGGSSVQTYRDGLGHAGRFQTRHAVYGRKGLPCGRCAAVLVSGTVGGRTTTWCPRCQPK
ncbi:MAG: formamidopyrimidine-DNA glycosylase [Phycisphaerae bacterium]|nr:MAG: formamidopyrimidine-DNA glycosylase [Phycisphaerae bacterium]